jgi:hypothetical protein
VLHALLESSVDTLIIAGNMIDTFLRAQGKRLHCTEVEPDMKSTAEAILQRMTEVEIDLVIPTDVTVLPTEFVNRANEQSTAAGEEAQPKYVPLNLDYSQHKAIQLGAKRVPLTLSDMPPGILYQKAPAPIIWTHVEARTYNQVIVDVAPHAISQLTDQLGTHVTNVLWIGTQQVATLPVIMTTFMILMIACRCGGIVLGRKIRERNPRVAETSVPADAARCHNCPLRGGFNSGAALGTGPPSGVVREGRRAGCAGFGVYACVQRW